MGRDEDGHGEANWCLSQQPAPWIDDYFHLPDEPEGGCIPAGDPPAGYRHGTMYRPMLIIFITAVVLLVVVCTLPFVCQAIRTCRETGGTEVSRGNPSDAEAAATGQPNDKRTKQSPSEPMNAASGEAGKDVRPGAVAAKRPEEGVANAGTVRGVDGSGSGSATSDGLLWSASGTYSSLST